MKKFLAFPLVVAALLGLASPAAAWPEKTVTLIVPFAAGGTADATGRLVARHLEEQWGVKVIVKNVAGATGTLGAAEVARARPDGHTLGWFPPGPAVGMPNMRKLPYGRDDLLPVAMLFEEISYFTTAKASPWGSLDELVADVKAHPGKYVMGAPGQGGAVHLSIYSMLKSLGLQTRFVPERSNADVLKAIAGGTTHFHAAQGAELQRFDIKAYFVVDAQRSAAFPDVPTAAELGYDIPRITNWYGVFAPAGLSDEVLRQLSAALDAVAHNEAFRQSAGQMACTVRYLPPEPFAAFYREQFDIYGALIQEITGGKAD